MEGLRNVGRKAGWLSVAWRDELPVVDIADPRLKITQRQNIKCRYGTGRHDGATYLSSGRLFAPATEADSDTRRAASLSLAEKVNTSRGVICVYSHCSGILIDV